MEDNNFYGPYRHKYITREIPKLDLVRKDKNYFQVEENIHVIKNFLSEEECGWFMSLVKESEEDKWNSDSGRGWWDKRIFFFNEETKKNKIIKDVTDRLRYLISDDQNLQMREGLTAIHRLRPGEEMFVHCDNPIDENYEIKDEHRQHVNLGLQYAVVLYINDFEGGELYYPNIKIKYKPEKGDAVWHPGVGKYLHTVLPVSGENTRYITTTYAIDEDIMKRNNILLGWN